MQSDNGMADYDTLIKALTNEIENYLKLMDTGSLHTITKWTELSSIQDSIRESAIFKYAKANKESIADVLLLKDMAKQIVDIMNKAAGSE